MRVSHYSGRWVGSLAFWNSARKPDSSAEFFTNKIKLIKNNKNFSRSFPPFFFFLLSFASSIFLKIRYLSAKECGRIKKGSSFWPLLTHLDTKSIGSFLFHCNFFCFLSYLFADPARCLAPCMDSNGPHRAVHRGSSFITFFRVLLLFLCWL